MEVRDLDEAIEWVKRCPNPMNDDTEIDIRRCFEAEDFAAADPTGEIMSKEQDLRDRMAATNT